MVQLDKISVSPAVLKLPQLFSLSPSSSRKGGNMQKRRMLASQTSRIETLSESSSVDQSLTNNALDNPSEDSDIPYVQNLKRTVRKAALSMPSYNSESSRDSQSDEISEHCFVLVSSINLSHRGPENKVGSIRNKRLFSTQTNKQFL